MNDLYKLKKQDIDASSDSIAKAFYDYPMFQHILADKLNHENIKLFLKFLINYSILYGNAYASSKEMEGIILFTDFKDYKFNLIRSIRSGILPLMKIGGDAGKRFNEFDSFTLKTHKRIMKDNHQYIIMIGVNPSKQGQGYGKKLMLSVLKLAEENGQSCYLETHGEKNVSFYNKLGFKVVSEDILPGTDIVQYAMLKEK
ncbi:GNAT family N-acetyltransferase [Clostridium sp. AL.422]|uniref:GNAT family N-acetyltransferase n=1 Tax=Clostridium TaxID=1485 RepID=UPI00293DE4DA|nr:MULTISPECIES: GNAT family N-acetyltransferase [unclassified Clostridium]MDV4149953.1 GNAT family N-acetyltransferase [Clostridium sp. AL.422]